MLSNKEELKIFFLLEDFANNMWREPIGIIIEENLSESERAEVMKDSKTATEDFKKYDKYTGIVKLYQHDPILLIQILFLYTAFKRTLHKFVMDIKDVDEIIKLFDSEDKMSTLLEKFDNLENDDYSSKYIGKVEYQENIYTFFIREFKRMKNLKLDETIYNIVCEWIILRIPRGEDALGVGYQSRIDIKKFIPTVMGMDLEKIGDIEIIKEYEEFNNPSTVQKFFQEIEDHEQIPLVELVIELSPIRSNPYLKIKSLENSSIGPSIKWFRENEKDLITDINSISECKIHYEKHRIRLVFTHEEEKGIVIRYGDNSLSLRLRNSFEDYMQKEFNLVVIPGINP
ncbi:hypothetical protein ES705_13982 [subsurface metagenome]